MVGVGVYIWVCVILYLIIEFIGVTVRESLFLSIRRLLRFEKLSLTKFHSQVNIYLK